MITIMSKIRILLLSLMLLILSIAGIDDGK